MKNWYIVQSHSSFENKVAGLIKEEADKAKIGEKFEEIIVPTHDVTEVKRGKRIQRKKKYFPGYVLIKSEMVAKTVKCCVRKTAIRCAWSCPVCRACRG